MGEEKHLLCTLYKNVHKVTDCSEGSAQILTLCNEDVEPHFNQNVPSETGGGESRTGVGETFLKCLYTFLIPLSVKLQPLLEK